MENYEIMKHHVAVNIRLIKASSCKLFTYSNLRWIMQSEPSCQINLSASEIFDAIKMLEKIYAAVVSVGEEI